MADCLIAVQLLVDSDAIRRYAHITGDFNPIHVDADFAAKSAMGGLIAHGTLSMNLIWQSLTATFGAHAVRGAAIDIRFVRPVRVGDTVEAAGVAQPDSRRRYDVWVKNQDGVNVIEGTLQLAQEVA